MAHSPDAPRILHAAMTTAAEDLMRELLENDPTGEIDFDSVYDMACEAMEDWLVGAMQDARDRLIAAEPELARGSRFPILGE